MRKKTVFNTGEIPHLWAHQTQESARNSQGNLYFEGKTIYSYGSHFPIATIWEKDENVIFFNAFTYSNTTSGQQRAVKQAIPPGIKIVEIPLMESVVFVRNNWGVSEGTIAEVHRKSIKWYLDNIDEYSLRHSRARKYSYKDEIESFLNRFREYIDIFRLKSKLLKAERELYDDPDAVNKLLQGRTGMQEVRKAQKRVHTAKEKKKASELLKKRQEYITKWTGDDKVKYVDGKCYLRINNPGNGNPDLVFPAEIETSKGATVPASDAKRIWKFIQAGKSIHGLEIGHYTVTSFNGVMNIGCHVIERDEIDRIGAELDKLEV